MGVCNALLIDGKDNVCVMNQPVTSGETVCFYREEELVELAALEDIPVFFKMAVSRINQGGAVIKYGTRIGLATRDISAGEMVHTHNLASG